MGKVDTYMKERTVPRIEGLIVGHKADGRCIYSKAGKTALVQACLHPGVSVAASALANGVNANLLRKWIRQHEGGCHAGQVSKRSQRSPDVLLPIQLSEPPRAACTSTQVAVKSLARTQSVIEIEYAGARVLLRGEVNAQQLGVVLTCLARAA